MAKRGADKYITDQNWDQEEENEEAGVFKVADKNVLTTRVIKKAKRTRPTEESESSGSGGVFKGFAGFGGFKKSGESSGGLFGNLGGKPLSFSNGSSGFSSTGGEAFKNSFAMTTATKSSEEASSNIINDTKRTSVEKSPSKNLTNGESDVNNSPSKSRSKYLHQLKSLNEGVSRWIKEHVDKNPYCILTPIFKDYEKHLDDLEKKFPQTEDIEEKVEKKIENSPKKAPFSTPTEKPPIITDTPADSGAFKIATTSSDGTSTAASAFKFGTGTLGGNPSTKALGVTSTGLFSNTSSSTGSGFSGFNFGSSSNKPSAFGTGGSSTGAFSFACSKKTEDGTTEASAGASNEEEYVPPKTEVAEVQEEGAVYTKRCKLFFKKDEQWKEKGVGNLHLKPCGGKTQLLVRADTNLGNILLNIMLSSSLPLGRQGKNNVTLMCVPNPPLDEKNPDDKTLVSMLIRVKTAEDADELYEKLKELKS